MSTPWGAIANLVGTGINAWTTSAQNKKARKFAKKQYYRELSDNWSMWNATNQYNSPHKQMQRFKSAGLNPNLIYGQGNSGPASTMSPPTGEAPKIENQDIGSGISSSVDSYFDTNLKQAQTNNVKAQTEVARLTKLLTEAKIYETRGNTDETKFDLGQKERLKDISAEAAGADLQQKLKNLTLTGEKTKTEITNRQLSIIRNNREAITTISKLLTDSVGRQQAKSIMSHRQVQKEIDQFKRQMWSKGQNPNDPAWQRQLMRFVESLVTKAKSGKPLNEGGKNITKNYYSPWNWGN